MKAYGYKRYDLLTCKFGCCGTKGNKHHNWREAFQRAARKAARTEGKAQSKDHE